MRLWDLLLAASTAGWHVLGRSRAGIVETWHSVEAALIVTSQDKELVLLLLLLREVEGPQPSSLPRTKYLTLAVARSGKHFSETLVLKENPKPALFVGVFPCQHACPWQGGCDLLSVCPSPWDSLAQDEQSVQDVAEGWVGMGTALICATIKSFSFKRWVLGSGEQQHG